MAFEGAPSFIPSIDGVVIADNIAGGNAAQHLAPFWGVGGLSAGTNHTLNVTIGLNPNVTDKSNARRANVRYFLIFVHKANCMNEIHSYTTDDDISNTITSTTISSSSNTAPAGSSTTSAIATTASSIPRKVSNVALIVGGIVGGVVLLVICLVACCGVGP